jgi:D-beta-D-heptose 7-phosphate kinase/D-beta-D-heptose 1-phosphate adenosyltransferase
LIFILMPAFGLALPESFEIMYKTADKVLALAPLARRCNAWRVRQDEVVFTYGPFLTLNLVDVRFLEEARAQGQRLVVGLIDAPEGTAELLAALFVVDGVVALHADELPAALEALHPEIVVSRPDSPAASLGHSLAGSRHVVL